MFDRVDFVENCAQRANIIEWLPFLEKQSVLIHSSAPSAVLHTLQSKNIQLQILSEAQIQKLATNPGRGMLDYILLVGMEVDEKLLAGLYRKLKSSGRLVLLVNNKYGMSYLAGKPAYDEAYYASLKGSTEEPTTFYSLRGIKKLLTRIGVQQFHMYYPDPNGIFATNIYSDKCLPKVGDCNIKDRNFTYDRIAMFDENDALNVAVEEEMYPEFANDFLVITGSALPIQMIRYSNDRAPEYQIKTEICSTADGKWVRKAALNPSGKAHIKKMEDTYKKLSKQFAEEVFTIVPCEWDGEYLAFPFVLGETLAEKMQKALQKKDKDQVFSLFRTYLEKLKSAKIMDFANYDFIFSNIIIEGDNWQIIDYEWTVEEETAPEDLAFRAAYCFSLEHPEFPFEEICQILGFGQARIDHLIQKETAYQRTITGPQASLDSLCEEHGGAVHTGPQLLRALELSTEDHKVQIYEDDGKGFLEERSYFVEHTLVRHEEMELGLQVSSEKRAIRVDPCEEPCLIQIKKLWWNGEEQFLDKVIIINGVKGKGSKNGYPEYVFATRDPNITIPLEKLPDGGKGTNELKLQIELHKLSLQLANTLSKSIKRII